MPIEDVVATVVVVSAIIPVFVDVVAVTNATSVASTCQIKSMLREKICKLCFYEFKVNISVGFYFEKNNNNMVVTSLPIARSR